jgi:hypothetical protein
MTDRSTVRGSSIRHQTLPSDPPADRNLAASLRWHSLLDIYPAPFVGLIFTDSRPMSRPIYLFQHGRFASPL